MTPAPGGEQGAEPATATAMPRRQHVPAHDTQDPAVVPAARPARDHPSGGWPAAGFHARPPTPHPWVLSSAHRSSCLPASPKGDGAPPSPATWAFHCMSRGSPAAAQGQRSQRPACFPRVQRLEAAAMGPVISRGACRMPPWRCLSAGDLGRGCFPFTSTIAAREGQGLWSCYPILAGASLLRGSLWPHVMAVRAPEDLVLAPLGRSAPLPPWLAASTPPRSRSPAAGQVHHGPGWQGPLSLPAQGLPP